MSILDKIDLKKKYPGYFNVWIIRSAFIFIALLGIISLFANQGQLTSYWAECPSDRLEPCLNPLYQCNETEVFHQEVCAYHKDNFCAMHEEMCTTRYIQPGQTIGKQPSFLFANFNMISLGIILLAFGINHLVWERKRK